MSQTQVIYVGPKPKIGLEIEANWPDYERLPERIRTAFALPNDIAHYVGRTNYSYFQNSFGPVSMHTLPATQRFYSELPDMKFPEGWDKGTDAGIEMRFDGPAETLEDAEDRIKRGTKWLRDFGFSTFTGAGTHVHLGHLAWLDAVFGATGPLHAKAETFIWGYFVTRERAIFRLAAPHRQCTDACTPYFSRFEGVTRYDPQRTENVQYNRHTPLWVLRDVFANNPMVYTGRVQNHHVGLHGGSTQNRRKGLPTLEFRHFSGTHSETAVRGYVRLLVAMFARATTLLTERNLNATSEDQADDPVIVQPFTYTVDDLKKEIDDPWLLKWMDKTIANNGEPITEIIETSSAPQAVAAA